MPTYRDHAVVLRTHKLGEADRIITLLSRSHGKVRAVARGVRRTSSKFGGRLEPFSHVAEQFATGRSLDVVTQVETLHAYDAPLRVDYNAFTAGQAMLETADRLVAEEGQPALRQYRLLLGALRTLGGGTPDGPRPATMVLDSYLLRALAIAGYAPPPVRRCGAEGRMRVRPRDRWDGVWHAGHRGPRYPARTPGGCWPPWSAATGRPPRTSRRRLRQASGLVAAFALAPRPGLRSLPLVEAEPPPAARAGGGSNSRLARGGCDRGDRDSWVWPSRTTVSTICSPTRPARTWATRDSVEETGSPSRAVIRSPTDAGLFGRRASLIRTTRAPNCPTPVVSDAGSRSGAGRRSPG